MGRRSQPERRRSMLFLVLLLIVWSICLGMGLAQATEPRPTEVTGAAETLAQAVPTLEVANPGAIGTVDVVPPRLQAGQTLYLENCATCHIGIPPAVMPSQTWQQLIQDSEHYGATIQPLRSPEIQILWQYLREYSRPLADGESTPYRIQQSRIFRAIHPRVTFAEKVTLTSCNSCHPGADVYDFRRLTAEWQNAP
ncbi:MAG: diheme cytochrome C [Leptolyngbyaceae cyanobacterium bins.349]|nr:diheme cytochrome C [Leptolyngbyaceae cyanobacterium bins.349]